ncbi:MAG: hypothetical protein CM15mP121_1900 [Bacteroidota bacterium]|nr:MAG: hypothetical protein CM15mP121_1900 [Bacteroidota bacterium]
MPDYIINRKVLLSVFVCLLTLSCVTEKSRQAVKCCVD